MDYKGAMQRAVAIVMLAVFAVLFGCDAGADKEAAARPTVDGDRIVFPQDSPQLGAILTEAANPAGTSLLRLPGRLAWDEDRTVRIFPAFAGRVVQIYVKPGDVVASGQMLARLASPDFGQAQADARKAASDFALAEKNLARVRELAEGGVAPLRELQAAESEHLRTQAELARASGRVRLYGDTARSVDNSFALKSPIAGTVVERSINPGQELRPDLMLGNGPPMFVITDPSRLWVFLDATEHDLPYLKAGETLALRSDAYPGETFTAHIEAISHAVDRETRTIKVRGTLANPEDKLKGEMYVTAEIASAPAKGVVVAAKAVFLQGSRHFVFVEEERGRYARREVQIGAESGGTLVITDGLRDRQRVVVDGNLFLQQILQSKGPA
ncbi:MAG TPA: efflux RND transporter periplasmic adaptor subunit [Burkholderiales bacterium]|nr:efflux RND transporter periplasmic adaptor subunit [Betaproteobacteria bacterium]HQR52599.1 efflux RND transporter periplasmic adaptor subunit [Burkholderiales bacterium]